jgi:hypothetical protein
MGLSRHPGHDMPNNYFDELGDGCPLILDDLFLTGNEKLIAECKRKLASKFEMKDLVKMCSFNHRQYHNIVTQP